MKRLLNVLNVAVVALIANALYFTPHFCIPALGATVALFVAKFATYRKTERRKTHLRKLIAEYPPNSTTAQEARAELILIELNENF